MPELPCHDRNSLCRYRWRRTPPLSPTAARDTRDRSGKRTGSVGAPLRFPCSVRLLPAEWWPGHPCKGAEEHRRHRWFALRGEEEESCCQGPAGAGELFLPRQRLCPTAALPDADADADADADLGLGPGPGPGPPARNRRGARSPLRAAKRRHSSIVRDGQSGACLPFPVRHGARRKRGPDRRRRGAA